MASCTGLVFKSSGQLGPFCLEFVCMSSRYMHGVRLTGCPKLAIDVNVCLSGLVQQQIGNLTGEVGLFEQLIADVQTNTAFRVFVNLALFFFKSISITICILFITLQDIKGSEQFHNKTVQTQSQTHALQSLYTKASPGRIYWQIKPNKHRSK